MPKKELLPDQDFQDSASRMTVEELKSLVTTTANNEFINQKNKSEDQHLAEVTESAKEAAAGYKEATAMNKAKTRFLLRLLADKGAF